MAYAQTAMFAIQAGLRLYGASRKAYADSIRGHALVLPLPRAPGIDFDTAVNWFLTQSPGMEIMQNTPRVKWLVELGTRTQAQRAELIDLYAYYRSETPGSQEDTSDLRGSLTPNEMQAMLEVRQWSDTETKDMATPLQLITGTLVNTAIDYFIQTPGLVSEDFPQGRALKAFFQALDQTDFARVPPKEIATGLMVAVLETVSDHPQVLGGGKNEQVLITKVSKALADAASHFLEDATDKERRDAGLWLNLIGATLLKSAAQTVLSDPGRYLNLQPGAKANVVVDVGRTITNLALGQNGINLTDLFSSQGLDKVARSAMVAVAKNPKILKIDNKGVENIVIALAKDLAALDDIFSTEILPELVRLVLDKSADNLDLLWPESQSDPEEHLLIKAGGILLKALSKPVPGATWRLHLTPDQLLGAAEAVLDEVIDNPAWLLQAAAGQGAYLQVAVEAILAALAKVPQNRLSTETGIAVLRAGISAVAKRLSLLEMPDLSGQPAQAAITAALDGIFARIFKTNDPEVHWHIMRNSALQNIVQICLSSLADHGATQTQIALVCQAIDALLVSKKPFDQEDFAEHLVELLSASV